MLLSTPIFFRLTIRFLFLFHEKYAIAHLPPPPPPLFLSSLIKANILTSFGNGLLKSFLHKRPFISYPNPPKN